MINQIFLKNRYPIQFIQVKFFKTCCKTTVLLYFVVFQTKELCREHAKGWRVHPLHDNLIVVINDRNTAVFCKENGVLLTPPYLLSSALAHEMAHSFSIGHSYSDQRKK